MGVAPDLYNLEEKNSNLDLCCEKLNIFCCDVLASDVRYMKADCTGGGYFVSHREAFLEVLIMDACLLGQHAIWQL